VAFVRQMPNLSPETYRQLSQCHSPQATNHDHELDLPVAFLVFDDQRAVTGAEIACALRALPMSNAAACRIASHVNPRSASREAYAPPEFRESSVGANTIKSGAQ